MTNQESRTPVADALRNAYEAKSIFEDDGVKVWGREVQNPYASARDRLQRAIDALLNLEGAEKQLGRVYVMYGDICARAAISGSVQLARKYYDEAIKIFEEIGDYDDLEVAVAKSVSLGR